MSRYIYICFILSYFSIYLYIYISIQCFIIIFRLCIVYNLFHTWIFKFKYNIILYIYILKIYFSFYVLDIFIDFVCLISIFNIWHIIYIYIVCTSLWWTPHSSPRHICRHWILPFELLPVLSFLGHEGHKRSHEYIFSSKDEKPQNTFVIISEFAMFFFLVEVNHSWD